MATIKDVARLAGVSVATVSRVINNSPKASEASRLAVHSAMESLSYHPNANARALAQQTTETVGLIVWRCFRSLFRRNGESGRTGGLSHR